MEASRRVSDNKIMQYGVSLSTLDGCEHIDMSDALAAQFMSMLPTNPSTPFEGIALDTNGVLSLVPVPAPSAPNPDVADYDANYDLAVTRLQQIIASGGTMTSAQAQAAITDLARIQLRVLKFIRARVGQ